jgi:small subunit ribosomal protein S20
VKHEIKTYERRVLAAIAANDAATASREFTVVSKKLDKAAARRILHRNAASRTKSRLAVRIAKLATGAK